VDLMQGKKPGNLLNPEVFAAPQLRARLRE
jgi:hypothetical protein